MNPIFGKENVTASPRKLKIVRYIMISVCFVLWPHLDPPKPRGSSLHFWYCWKGLNEVMCRIIISQFSNQRIKNYQIYNDFCHWKFIKIYKFGFFNQPMHLHHIGPYTFLFTSQTLTPRLTTLEYTLVPIKGLVHICHKLANNNWTISTNLCIFTILDLQFPLSHHLGKCMGNFPWAILFGFSDKNYKNELSQWGFLEVVFLKDSKTIFWKVVALRALQITTLGQIAQGPTSTYEKMCSHATWKLIS